MFKLQEERIATSWQLRKGLKHFEYIQQANHALTKQLVVQRVQSFELQHAYQQDVEGCQEEIERTRIHVATLEDEV